MGDAKLNTAHCDASGFPHRSSSCHDSPIGQGHTGNSKFFVQLPSVCYPNLTFCFHFSKKNHTHLPQTTFVVLFFFLLSVFCSIVGVHPHLDTSQSTPQDNHTTDATRRDARVGALLQGHPRTGDTAVNIHSCSVPRRLPRLPTTRTT